MIERRRSRLRTMEAMAALCAARLLVETIPFNRWRNLLGSTAEGAIPDPAKPEKAKRLAADVEWAAKKLPFATKCLPRAMALSWLLRRQGLAHAIVIAVRPADPQTRNRLHAWVEIDGDRILGSLPGPWIELLQIGAKSGPAATFD